LSSGNLHRKNLLWLIHVLTLLLLILMENLQPPSLNISKLHTHSSIPINQTRPFTGPNFSLLKFAPISSDNGPIKTHFQFTHGLLYPSWALGLWSSKCNKVWIAKNYRILIEEKKSNRWTNFKLHKLRGKNLLHGKTSHEIWPENSENSPNYHE